MCFASRLTQLRCLFGSRVVLSTMQHPLVNRLLII